MVNVATAGSAIEDEMGGMAVMRYPSVDVRMVFDSAAKTILHARHEIEKYLVNYRMKMFPVISKDASVPSPDGSRGRGL